MRYEINYRNINGKYDGFELELINDISTEDGLIELCNAIIMSTYKHKIESVYEIVDLD